jgi:hypothetical protein
MTGRTGQAEQNRTGEMERQNRKGKTRQSGQESIKGQAELIRKTRKAEQGCQDKTARR